MNTRRALTLATVVATTGLMLVLTAFSASSGSDKKITKTWNFEDTAVGKLPAGWNVEATNQRGPLATWQVTEDTTAPSGKHVLALTKTTRPFGGTFNLCWTDSISFLDGEITVHFKAMRGVEDQGGGVIWRAQDKDNYYISRANPLENNFRVYYVKAGARRMLASARIKLTHGIWYTLRIVHRGTHIEGFLNGKKMLDAKDSTFSRPGGVGLWTRADAETEFDDFTCTLEK